MAEKVRTAEMSWREVAAARDRGAAVLVPMGSTEEHGPHAPTGDYAIAETIAERVARQTKSVVSPVIPFGYSEYFRNYPGTITLQPETLALVVNDTVSCLLDQGFRHVILVNGHQGNHPVLMPLVRKIRRQRGVLIPIVAPLGFGLTPEVQRELYGDTPMGHGGEPIGSVASYLFPDLVDVEKAEEWASLPYQGLPATLNGVIFQGRQVGLAINMEDITPESGSLSDPKLASPERGRRIVEEAVESLSAFVEWFKGVNPAVQP